MEADGKPRDNKDNTRWTHLIHTGPINWWITGDQEKRWEEDKDWKCETNLYCHTSIIQVLMNRWTNLTVRRWLVSFLFTVMIKITTVRDKLVETPCELVTREINGGGEDEPDLCECVVHYWGGGRDPNDPADSPPGRTARCQNKSIDTTNIQSCRWNVS